MSYIKLKISPENKVDCFITEQTLEDDFVWRVLP